MKRLSLKWIFVLVCCLVAVLIAAPATADWDPGDGHKMHFPQLPDPNGWDIDVVTDTIYDDFRCAETGPINDIHFWVSWKDDFEGEITFIDLSLHGDVPDDVSGLGYSHPDSTMYDENNRLWFRRFQPGEFTYRLPPGQGLQGWFEPVTPLVHPNNHNNYFQINIDNFAEPFVQEKDEIYWLGVHIGVLDSQTMVGWKTTQDHWNDDAAYYHGGWQELIDPIDGVTSLDMAFVITPEPTSGLLCMFGLVGLMFVRSRRR